MAKHLKISFPEKCIGCELCVAKTQMELNKVGLDGALIRIFKERREGFNQLVFSIQIDPTVNKMAIEKIKEICPTKVFTIEEQKEDASLLD
jgi:ferredoxin